MSSKDRRKRKHEEGEAVAEPAAAPAAAPAPGTPPENSAEYWKDKALRAQAEMINVRRRAEQEIDERARVRLEGVLADLIQCADNLELALGSLPPALAAGDGARPFLDGLGAIQASLALLLARNGVEPIQPQPQDGFDPVLHEAVLVESRADAAQPRLELLRRGYRVGRRILRPAQVRLVQPASTPPAQD